MAFRAATGRWLRGRRGLLLLGLLAAGAVAAWFLLRAGGPWPGRGPAEWAKMDLPRLRVASSPAWGREWSPAVVIRREPASGPAVEVLLGYDPADGEERHRAAWRQEIPWPARRPKPGRGSTGTALLAGMAFRPALLLLAEAATPWWRAHGIPGDDWCIQQPRLYLGGRLPDGRLGAVPMFVDAEAEDVVTRLGAGRCPPNFAEPGCLELRITRDDGGVRYRFGHYAVALMGPRRFDGGDVRLPPEAALAPGEGPLIPDLAALLRERFSTPRGPRAAVWLEVGEHVRFVDVLRAVECGGGSPEVVFSETCRLYVRAIEGLNLPAPRVAADAVGLVEDYSQPGRVRLNLSLTEDGRDTVTKARGQLIPPEDLPATLAPAKATLVRADLRAPWGSVLRTVRAVREEALALQFAFVEEEEGFEPERFLAVPPPPEGAPVTEGHRARGRRTARGPSPRTPATRAAVPSSSPPPPPPPPPPSLRPPSTSSPAAPPGSGSDPRGREE